MSDSEMDSDMGEQQLSTLTSSEPVAKVDTFAELGVCEELQEACRLLKWEKPSEIQCASIPWALKGRDVIALAETGSGKTGAFAIPVLQALLDKPTRLFALVMAPTRELCVQIAEQFKALGAGIGLEVCTILGGVDMSSQALELARKPHIIVASPGRLVDHLENTRGFSLKTCRYLVLDEADRLLSLDYEVALEKVIDVLPKDRRTLLFSATMTSKVSKLQRAALTNPVKVEVASKYGTASKLIQEMALVPAQLRTSYVYAILSHFSAYSAMLFCNSCQSAQVMAATLRQLGIDATCLHGKMTQPQRLGALNVFKSRSHSEDGGHGQRMILVTTEVGSRGLDIPHVHLVINVDVPLTSKDYVHRVGRTARAGRTGRAVTLVSQYEVEPYQKVEFALGKKLDVFNDVALDTAKLLFDRVAEAQRMATMQVKEEIENKMASKARKEHASGSGQNKPKQSMKFNANKRK